MKKILAIITLALATAWVIVEISPDPIFSPHPQAPLSFQYKLESAGEVAQGLKINSSDAGEVVLAPLSSTQWILSVRKTSSTLMVNGAGQESLLLAMKDEWESPFLVNLAEESMLPESISTKDNQLPPELNQILTNRRKNLARVLFLPKFSKEAFRGKCYYGVCLFNYVNKEDALSLKVSSQDANSISANYELEVDELGAESIKMTEKTTIDDFIKISLNSSASALRIAQNESHLSLKPEDFKSTFSITLSGTTGAELKAQLIKETESIDLGKFIGDVRARKRTLEDLGTYHQTLKKVLLTRPESVKILLKELKRSKTEDPFYISSIAALISVDSDETQKGLRDLVDYHSSKKAILEAKSLIMGLGQSANPSPDTVDYILEKAYGADSRKEISEMAQLATGSIARATEDQAVSAKLMDKPLRELEDFVQGHGTTLPLSNVLEVIGNSGSPSAFKNLKIVFERNKDPQTQVAVLNALRYMPQKEAAKILEERLTSADQVIREQARQALELRCEQYPQYCR